MKKYNVSFLLSVVFCVFIGVKTNSFAYDFDSHVHEYVSEINSNTTHHWRDCVGFPSQCPGPNQSVWATFESHIPGNYWNNDCRNTKVCVVCESLVGYGYPSHDIPIEGGKCRHAGCDVTCDHGNQKSGNCQFCGINLDDPSANVYVHVHQWGNDFAYGTFLYDSNADYHWMNCYNPECPITDISGKNGFGTHVYELDDTCATEVVCSVCDYCVRIGYSKHAFSSVDGKCEREDCEMACPHSVKIKGICQYCGYIEPVKETPSSAETDELKTANSDESVAASEGAENITANDSVGDSSLSEGTSFVMKNSADTTTVDNDNESVHKSEGGFFRTIFGKIASFFKRFRK